MDLLKGLSVSMTMASLDAQWTLISLLLFLTAVASAIDVRDTNIDEYINYINPPAVHKFRNEHGDSILCVLYTDQISLQGSEQRSMQTTEDRKTKSGLNYSSDDVKTECPEGTVPIMETKREHVERAGSVTRFISKRIRHSAEDAINPVHEYGAVQFRTTEPVNGASAGLNIWQPYVDTDNNGVFSLSQMWVINDGPQVETIESGWIVYPQKFGDSQTRFFVYWTADGYNNTGCYNTNCPGFVLAPNPPMYPGSPLTPLSIYNGTQYIITLKVIKEMQGDNDTRWTLYVNNQTLGCWPGSLYKNLQSNANRVDFGGEVCSILGSQGSQFSTTDMGSGHFASGGFGHSAFIRDIQITDDHGVLINIPGKTIAYRPQCYNVSLDIDNKKGNGIFFGGGDFLGCVF